MTKVDNHFYDEEEGLVLAESHPLVAVVDTEFDESGKCTAFNIVEIHSSSQ